MEPWIWILLIIVLVFAMFTGFVFKTTSLIRKMVFGERYDDDHTLHYFTVDDFEGLRKKDFEFSSNGYTLKGYVYQMEEKESKGNIVFAHGIGAGHIQYTTEIHFFAKEGYKVYAFDAQGCLNSEGKGMEYLTNYVKNLDDFLTYLENSKEMEVNSYILVGHSLGAYGVNVMAKFHKERIEKIISISGFNDPKTLIKDILNSSKLLSGILGNVFIFQEKRKNKSYAISSIDALKNFDKKVLFLSGDEDSLVNPTRNFFLYQNSFQEKDFCFLLVKGRAHRPLLSLKGAKYDAKRTEDLNVLKERYKNNIPEAISKEYFENLDYSLLVELDEKVMQIIHKFLMDEEIEKNMIIEAEDESI